MRYRYADGFEFEANGARDVCEKLWQSKFVPEPTLEEWMKGFARRIEMWDGTIVRSRTPEELVDDLLLCGQLIIIAE